MPGVALPARVHTGPPLWATNSAPGFAIDVLKVGADGLTEHVRQPALLEGEVLHRAGGARHVEDELRVRPG